MIEFDPTPENCSDGRVANGVVQYLVGLLTIQEISDCDMFLLQVLVVLEEILDLLNCVWRDIGNV